MIFLAFLAGIFWSHFFDNFIICFLTAVFIIAAIFFLFKGGDIFSSDILLLVLFVFLGMTSAIAVKSNNLKSYVGGRRLLTLQVTTLPRVLKNAHLFRARVNNTSSQVNVLDYSKSMIYGHTYRFRGKVSTSFFPRSASYIVRVPAKTLIIDLPLGLWQKLKIRTVTTALGVFKRYCDDRAYRFLGSVVLGRRELLSREERSLFASCGISHLLAISGLHIGLITYVLFFFLRLLHIAFPWRLTGLLLFLCFYASLTGMSPPVVRAVSMYGIFTLSFFARRRLHPLNVLGLAGLLILLIDPACAFLVSFQLSFAAVLAIIIGLRYFVIFKPGNSFLVYIKYIAVCSFCVTLVLLPLISYYFNAVHFLTIVYNIVFIPFFTFIVFSAVIFIIFSFAPIIAESLGFFLSLIIDWFMRTAEFLALFMPGPIAYRFTFLQIAVYYFLLAVALVAIYRYRAKRIAVSG